MKATTLFVTFYEQIGKAYLVNRPMFISALFKAGGSTHEIAETKKQYGGSDYRYKICNGTKPISIELKRSFPNEGVDVEKLADYFKGHISRNKNVHCPALMASFGVDKSLEQDAGCLAMALALQFKAFINDKESDEVTDIIASEYERLISEKAETKDNNDTLETSINGELSESESAKDVTPKSLVDVFEDAIDKYHIAPFVDADFTTQRLFMDAIAATDNFEDEMRYNLRSFRRNQDDTYRNILDFVNTLDQYTGYMGINMFTDDFNITRWIQPVNFPEIRQITCEYRRELNRLYGLISGGGSLSVFGYPPSENVEIKTEVGNDGWISAYCEKTIAEYGKMRTSLFDKTAKDFYSFYVRCDIKRNDQMISDVNAARLCTLSRRAIISASGGFGKSTMMRHLLLSAVEQYNESGLLPIFIRLGDFAYSDAADMLDFALEQATCYGAEVKKQHFVSLLEKGKCLLLMDGLDEVTPKEIKRLDYKMRPFFSAYAMNVFVVTTRPYPIHKLNSLGNFDVMELQPLGYKQAVELVKKREKFFSDSTNDSKLSDVLTREIFKQHESLMRNPKLLTVMLTTYGKLNLIPDKRHILYQEVIRSLTELYDTESDNVNRMLKTRLSVRVILNRFSALCYNAYENGELDFTEQTIVRYLQRADKGIDAGDFLFDLCENLCFLEVSGGRFRFFHRSMQEYFCASYVTQLPPEQWSGVYKTLNAQPQDYNESVLRYLYEMDAAMVEKHIFLPFLSELFGNFKKHTGYYNYLFSQYPVIYYDHEDPLEQSENQPLSFLLQFVLVELDLSDEYYPHDFPFYEEFVKWVTVMPVFTFSDDTVSINVISDHAIQDLPLADDSRFEFSDKADEVMPPERMLYSSYKSDDGDTVYEEMGWELEFNPQEVYASYENEGKYGDLVKFLDRDSFEIKEEYFTVFDYYETLKSRYLNNARGNENV